MFLAIGVKDTQLYPLGMSGEKCEIDALTVVMRAEGSGSLYLHISMVVFT